MFMLIVQITMKLSIDSVVCMVAAEMFLVWVSPKYAPHMDKKVAKSPYT